MNSFDALESRIGEEIELNRADRTGKLGDFERLNQLSATSGAAPHLRTGLRQAGTFLDKTEDPAQRF